MMNIPLRRVAVAMASVAVAITVVSLAVADDALSRRLAPAARLAVPAPAAPTTEPAVAPTPKVLRRPYLPPLGTAIAPRPLATALQASLPAASDPTPAPVRAKIPSPGRPQFAQPARFAVAPPTRLQPRIPNLLGNPRRAQWATANPIVVPAAAVATPSVNNLDGTAALAPLSPFTRGMTVEIAQPPAPLTVDQEPYLQAVAAPDDQDVPARSDEVPVRPLVK